MKHVFSILLFALVLVSASPPEVQAQNIGEFFDTLKTSSSIDTVKFYPGGSEYNGAGSLAASALYRKGAEGLSILLRSDSLSGATAAVVLFQVTNNTTPAEADWYTVSSQTLNGPTDQAWEFTDEPFTHRRWRLLCYTTGGNGTQQTKVWGKWFVREGG